MYNNKYNEESIYKNKFYRERIIQFNENDKTDKEKQQINGEWWWRKEKLQINADNEQGKEKPQINDNNEIGKEKEQKNKNDERGKEKEQKNEQSVEYENILIQQEELEEEYKQLLDENNQQELQIQKDNLYIYILLFINGLLLLFFFIFIGVKVYFLINEKKSNSPTDALYEAVKKTLFLNSVINNNMLSDSLDDFEAPNLARINYNKNRILTNNPDIFIPGQGYRYLYKPYSEDQI